ncbi:MAG: alpha/beta hydrolase family protein [Chitinophagales bacterium]
MKQKLYLFPGFGETERCFRNLKPFLRDYELIDVDYRPVLKNIPLWETTPTNLATELIHYYGIKPEDKLVGHSMGGYFSYVISGIKGNSTCLIGSFSDPNKIVRFSESKLLNVAITGSGLIKTDLLGDYLVKQTKEPRARQEMIAIKKNFRSFSNMAMAQMSMLSFGEDLPPSPIQPFYIHAKDDRVVRTPDAAYHNVRGGHFCLIFHPDEVYEKMEIWLNQ